MNESSAPIISGYPELKGIRRKQSISQEQIAEVLGIDQTAYSSRESGRTGFKLEEIPLVAKALKLSINDVNRIFFKSSLK
jgi:transcriptional regulator with XRE-family HTH domain